MRHLASALLFLSLLHCGSSTGSSDPPATGAPTGTPPGSTTPPGTSTSTTPPGTTPPPGTTAMADPSKDGPFAIQEIDATTHVAATNDDVPIHVALPTTGGPFPVVVLAHGFQLPASQYYGYLKRLATFGYVALAADYPAGLLSKSNLKDVANLSGALDWAIAAPELAGKIDATKAGVMGHSRGGKDAVLAAVSDARFKAVLGLDPVDSGSPAGCDAKTECPDASDAMKTFTVPTAFLGEITDAEGGMLGQSCAPKKDNFATFYASATTNSLSFTLAGANHMSFLDDPSTCTLQCAACNKATADHDAVLGLAYATTVAFFERHLRGVTAADDYLDGATAQSRYVTTGLATIQKK